MKFAGLWRSGCPISGKRSSGAMTIRFSRQRTSRWGRLASLKSSGLEREHWSSASPIRTIFREAFERAGLPYFNPHSFRNTLVRLGQDVCKSPEEFKAWSQNLGHEKVLTTFISYGEVPVIVRGRSYEAWQHRNRPVQSDVNEIAEAMIKKLRDSGVDMQVK